MTDRPILFSAPMIRALLAGTKTQTRRIIRSARVFATPESKAFTLRGDDLSRALQNASRFRRLDGNGWFWEADAFEWQAPAMRTGWMAHIGYAPGDRLYVREHWRTVPSINDMAPKDMIPHLMPIAYIADDGHASVLRVLEASGRFRQGMHMPRWASRITLHVTQVLVQRLQEISEADAFAEGISTDGPVAGIEVDIDGFWWAGAGKERYRKLWNSINGEGSWDASPWVVAVSFTVEHCNIAQARQA